MADILIRGYSMPASCATCHFNNNMFCDVLGLKIKFPVDYIERPGACPLHELPEHGDLISAEDAKTVIDRFIGYLDEDMIFRIKYKLNQDCPVIVPSNREETE